MEPNHENQKKVLIIKTSSLGDVIHTLPALTDAQNAIPEIRFDWVVEESFAEVCSWHKSVSKVIPVKLRQWRKSPLKTLRSDEWKAFKAQIKQSDYDAVIDAQGLLKSALLTPMTSGPVYGYDKQSVREPLSAWFYDHKIPVSREQHAVERTRQLLAQSLGYSVPETRGDYGIKAQFTPEPSSPYVVFLHGTTWDTKHYPEAYWKALVKKAADTNFQIKLLWGNTAEHERAQRLASSSAMAEVMPKLPLTAIAQLLAGAQAAIAVDTGLGHLAAAVDCPTLSLFQSTNPGLSGAYGSQQKHLHAQYQCAPCMRRKCPLPAEKLILSGAEVEISPACATVLDPDKVWQAFIDLQQVL